MLDCIIRGWWRSLKSGFKISGHDYVDVERYENATVTISRCEHCGDTTISWVKNEV